MSVFNFRQFAVVNERSAMKVNTDGVLLGALMRVLPQDHRMLDVGTGTGTIALMAAQRKAEITPGGNLAISAIDIDRASAEEAAMNFSASPWKDSLFAVHASLEEFERRLEGSSGEATQNQGMFDLIFSNPPYFESSLKAPDSRRRAARHAETLSYRDLCRFASKWLSPEGRLALVLPAETETELRRCAASYGFYLVRIVRIRTTPKRMVSRIVAEFARNAPMVSPVAQECSPTNSLQARRGIEEESLTIQDGGAYTREYLNLVRDFLLLEK